MPRPWLSFIFLSASVGLQAQTPPCGIATLQIESSKNGGSKTGQIFLPAAPEHVRFAVLRVLPAFAAKISNDAGLHIEAKIDRNANIDLKKNSVGTFVVDIRPENRGGASGSLLNVEFLKPHSFGGNFGRDGYAKPFLDEAACLSRSLAQDDPVRNPRGLPQAPVPNPRPVTLPENTRIKILVLDPVYSRNLENLWL